MTENNNGVGSKTIVPCWCDRLRQFAHNLKCEPCALKHEKRERANELRSLSSWIRRPGNIDPNDAIDSCARVLENRATALLREIDAMEKR